MGKAREVMDRAAAAFVSQDWETVRSLYAPDAVLTDPQTGSITGGAVEFFKTFTDAFPDIAFHLENAHESGNVAIDEGFVTGSNTGALELPNGQTVPPTGRRVRLRTCDVATIENGVVVRHNFYYDQLELLTQLGLVPEGSNA